MFVADREPRPVLILQSPVVAPPPTAPLRTIMDGSHNVVLIGTVTVGCRLNVSRTLSERLWQPLAIDLIVYVTVPEAAGVVGVNGVLILPGAVGVN